MNAEHSSLLSVCSFDKMSFSDWPVNPFTSRFPHVGQLNMWNPFIPNLMTRSIPVYTSHGHRSGSMSHKLVVFIFNTPAPAGCDAYPGIIVNFCLNPVWWIKRQRLKQLPGGALNHSQTDSECIILFLQSTLSLDNGNEIYLVCHC